MNNLKNIIGEMVAAWLHNRAARRKEFSESLPDWKRICRPIVKGSVPVSIVVGYVYGLSYLAIFAAFPFFMLLKSKFTAPEYRRSGWKYIAGWIVVALSVMALWVADANYSALKMREHYAHNAEMFKHNAFEIEDSVLGLVDMIGEDGAVKTEIYHGALRSFSDLASLERNIYVYLIGKLNFSHIAASAMISLNDRVIENFYDQSVTFSVDDDEQLVRSLTCTYDKKGRALKVSVSDAMESLDVNVLQLASKLKRLCENVYSDNLMSGAVHVHW